MNININNQNLGSLLDPKYKTGPTQENRKCTDLTCSIIFGIFTLLTLIISIIALSKGNPSTLAQPYDPDHNPCGVGDLENFPFIYFVSPAQETLYRTVCVSECPKTNNNSNQGTLKCKPNSVVTSCKSNLSPGNAEQRILYYDTTPYTGKVCLPTVSEYFDKVKLAMDANKVSQSFGDLRNTWMIICFSGFFAIGLGYLILKLVENKPKFLIWGLIIGFIVGLLLMSLFFLFKYNSLTSTQDVNLNDVYSSSNQVQSQIARQDTPPGEYLFMFFLFFFLAIIIGCIILCMKDRINLSVTVISCAAKVIEDTKESIFIPVIFYIISFMYFMFWVVIATNLYSLGTVTDKPKALPFGQFQFSTDITYFAYIHFFSLIWNSAFLIGSCQFIVLGVASYWYYQRNRNAEVKYVQSSFLLFLKYHIGTVAFGSILVALLDAIRVLLEFIYNQVEEHQHTQNKILKSILKCLEKVFQIFENFLQYINKNSYAMTVMTGEGFKDSTKKVHQLIERQKVRQTKENRIVFGPGFGEVFEVISNLTIMMVSTIFCYLIISNAEYYTSRLHSPVAPTMCFLILSYCVGSYFMSLLGTAADGLIVLYFMDEDMHPFQDNENQGQTYNEAQFEPDELKVFEKEQDHIFKHKQIQLQQQNQ